MENSKVTALAVICLAAVSSVKHCEAAAAGDASQASKSRFDAILAQFGFHGLQQPDAGLIDNLVERELDQHQGDVVNSLNEDSKLLGGRVARRVPLVRLDLDNRPFLVYGDDSKLMRKVKKVKKAPLRRPKASASPLDLRDLRRRPRLVVLNSEGELVPPRLHHLNVRVPKMYSFKSRFPKRQRESARQIYDVQMP